MKAVVDITIENRTNRYSRRVRVRLQAVITKWARRLERETKRLAPVDTGRLRANIYAEIETLAANVISGTHYAVHQEFGTRFQSGTPHVRPPFEKHAAAIIKDLRGALQ